MLSNIERKNFNTKSNFIKTRSYFSRFFAGVTALFGIYLLIAWASYTPLDNAWSIANNSTIIQNKAGAFGAWWIDVFLSIFGQVGNFIPFIFFFIPIFILTQHISFRSYWRVIFLFIGISLFLVGLSILATLLSTSFNWENGGGAIGGLLVQTLYPILNKSGLLFIAILSTILGFLLGAGTDFLKSIVHFYNWINAKDSTVVSQPVSDSVPPTELEEVVISGLNSQKINSTNNVINQQETNNKEITENISEDTASITDILNHNSVIEEPLEENIQQDKTDLIAQDNHQIDEQIKPEKIDSTLVTDSIITDNYTRPNIIGLSKSVESIEPVITEENNKPNNLSQADQNSQLQNTADIILPTVSLAETTPEFELKETLPANNIQISELEENKKSESELEQENHAELVRQFEELERQKFQELEHRAKALNAEDTLKLLLSADQVDLTSDQATHENCSTRKELSAQQIESEGSQPSVLPSTTSASVISSQEEHQSVVEENVENLIEQPQTQEQLGFKARNSVESLNANVVNSTQVSFNQQEINQEEQVVSGANNIATEQVEKIAEDQKPNYKPYVSTLIHPLLQPKTLEKPTTPMPTLELLDRSTVEQAVVTEAEITEISQRIEQQLRNFNIKATVKDVLIGPVVTRYDIELHPGVKASRVTSIETDLARSLMLGAIRIAEMIPGKPYVGIETPNRHRQVVPLRDVLDSEEFRNATSPLSMALGKDISGKPVVVDLAKMPHLLVAGSTGSGKSVGVNTMILSLLFKVKPDQVKFIMIDPKQVELNVYNDIPHLLTEVVTDMKKAANALRWCVDEMERRYQLLSALRVRNLDGYNEKIEQAEEMGLPIPNPIWRPGDTMDQMPPALEKLPYIVVIVDEFADLMMIVGKSVEELIARLAQKARAIGIHLILATQRPSVDVITGLIKSNIPSRIAFTVASKIDSRTILDTSGAESLLGKGDMLYSGTNSNQLVRVHGAFMTTDEVVRVADDWRARGTPQYLTEILETGEDEQNEHSNRSSSGDLDDRFDEAVAAVLNTGNTSATYLQRSLGIGFPRAARILDQMEEQGILSSPTNGKREILDRRGEY